MLEAQLLDVLLSNKPGHGAHNTHSHNALHQHIRLHQDSKTKSFIDGVGVGVGVGVEPETSDEDSSESDFESVYSDMDEDAAEKDMALLQSFLDMKAMSARSSSSSSADSHDDLSRANAPALAIHDPTTYSSLNYTEKLCSRVRESTVESIIDIIVQWFPCLHRLVTELQSYHNKEVSVAMAGLSGTGTATMETDSNTIGRNKTHGETISPMLDKSGNKKQSGNAIGRLLGRKETPPARMLGSILSVCADLIAQLVYGLTPTMYQAFSLPQELVAVYKEAQTDPSTPSQKTHAHPNVATSTTHSHTTTTANNTSANTATGTGTGTSTGTGDPVSSASSGTSVQFETDRRMLESLISSTQPHLTLPLQDAHLRHSLHEVFELYDLLEVILTPTTPKAVAGGSGAPGGDRPPSVTTTPIRISSQEKLNNFSESNNDPAMLAILDPTKDHHFSNTQSPYYAAMVTLQHLSREGEEAWAHRLMDRLVVLTASMVEYDWRGLGSFSADNNDGTNLKRIRSATWKNSMSRSLSISMSFDQGEDSPIRDRANGQGVLTNHLKTVATARVNTSLKIGKLEQSVLDLEHLMDRCLERLEDTLRRPEWVATPVVEGIHSVLALFDRALQREASLLGSMDSIQSLLGGGGSGSFGGSRASVTGGVGMRTSSPNKRRSSQQSRLLGGISLRDLDQELTLGLSTQHNEQKKDLLLDLLRACIQLRSRVIRKAWKSVRKTFVLPADKAAEEAAAAKEPFQWSGIGIDYGSIYINNPDSPRYKASEAKGNYGGKRWEFNALHASPGASVNDSPVRKPNASSLMSRLFASEPVEGELKDRIG